MFHNHLEDDVTLSDQQTCWSWMFCIKKCPSKSTKIQRPRNPIKDSQYSKNQVGATNVRPKSVQASKQPSFHHEKSIYEYPKNKLFLLRCRHPQNSVLVKITEKHFNLELNTKGTDDPKSSSLVDQIQKSEMFKLFDLGIQCTNNESWIEATPEKIARYIAQRVCEQSLIIDLGCGIGGNTIQFAQECDFVIGVEINFSKILDAQFNCRKYKVSEKVDLVWGNLLTLNSLKADVVFINPSFKEVDIVDLFRDCSPNIYQLMEKVLHIAPNVILQLPKNIDITQLPAIFDIRRYDFLQEKYSYNYALEIECVYINKQIEYYIVYFGIIAHISDLEINEYLSRQLISQGSQVDGINITNKLPKILSYAKDKIGSYRLFKLINNLTKRSVQDLTLIQQFMDTLYEQKVIKKCDIQQILAAGRSQSCDLIQEGFIQDSPQGIKQQLFQKQQSVLVTSDRAKKKTKQGGESPPIDERMFSPENFYYQNEEQSQLGKNINYHKQVYNEYQDSFFQNENDEDDSKMFQIQ